jgi:hypothetical protein
MYPGIVHTVKKLFALRLFLQEQNVDAAVPDLRKSLLWTDSSVDLDLGGLIVRINALNSIRDFAIKGTLRKLDQLKYVDVRRSSRGHDFLDVVRLVIRRLNGNVSIAEALPNLLIFYVLEKSVELLAPFET